MKLKCNATGVVVDVKSEHADNLLKGGFSKVSAPKKAAPKTEPKKAPEKKD